MKLRITPLRILLLLSSLILVVLVRYAIRDMNLDVDLLRESLLNMPGVVMENIRLSREISGDIWRVQIPYLDRDGETINMKSLDIVREISGDKGEWKFFGHSGTYSHDVKAASITGLQGTLDENGRSWELESPKLTWTEESGSLVFPEGLVVYDGEFMLRSPLASMDTSGVILLQHGGVIKWLKPLTR
ncbi:MAG: hypothetical protein IJP89_11215 [Synergistaceae bacterium]|nr:hypothetical protein [Synergistaceae bacterium]